MLASNPSIMNTEQHIPLRTCIGCGRTRPQGELIRMVADLSGQPAVDSTGRQRGRGAYLCSRLCLKAAAKRRAFQRAFRGKVQSVDLTSLELALLR